MLPTQILGIVCALTSAIVYGGGDFCGGYATRCSSQYQVLTNSAFSGLVVLIVAMGLWREPFPATQGTIWAMLGGISGALGIAAFYRALSMDHNASIAPTAAVIGAALPVVFGALTEGLPAITQLIGFGLALAGIWLASAVSNNAGGVSRRGFLLACLAGVGFSGFFIFLGQVERGKIFSPLVIARCLTLVTGLVLVKTNHLRLLSLRENPAALLAGLLDAGGNLFYLLAKQFTRLDIAVVLSSLYPASTVILASLILKEKVSRSQGVGVIICLAAIILITL